MLSIGLPGSLSQSRSGRRKEETHRCGDAWLPGPPGGELTLGVGVHTAQCEGFIKKDETMILEALLCLLLIDYLLIIRNI